MPHEDFGCELTMPPAQGRPGETVVLLADVDREFLGMSITEKHGLEMRRVCAELHDLDQITKLRDSLTAHLARRGRK